MKVLVLSGRFGMGHEMAANAICEQFRKLDKDTEIVKKDLLEELYPHISKLIFGGFRLMVEHCHGIYNFIYKMSGKMKVEMQPRGAAIYKKLKKILEKEQPDVIVCTHPMCVKAIASYKEKTGLSTNISKYMRWADLVITKAGGITLFEILHSQVPLFVIHPFLEQEMNNARYAAEKGFAKVVWGKHEDYIPELEKLLNDRKLLKQMDENVRHARKEMIDVSLDKAVEIMEERMTA